MQERKGHGPRGSEQGREVKELADAFQKLYESDAVSNLSDTTKARVDEIKSEIENLKKDLGPGPGPRPKHGQGPRDGGKRPGGRDEMRGTMDGKKEKAEAAFTQTKTLLEEGIKLFG